MTLHEADSKCTYVQKIVFEQHMNGRKHNSVSAQMEHREVETDTGRFVINDIRYADVYPNSFLDIWYPSKNRSKARPVIINFHGGGFIFGSKKMGDPLAVSASDGEAYFDGFLDAGFIILNADYALAPEFRFPIQIRQADQVVRFVLENADKYGFDASNITMTGGSAGADITEIYALAISNADFAKKLGFEPSLRAEGLRCVIINEAALQMGVNVLDNNMCAMLQCWLGVEDAVNGEQSRLADVASNINGVYPPAFFIASNTGNFFKADLDAMSAVLDKFGLPYESYYVERSIEPLDHGFINQLERNKYAADCYKRVLSFLKKYTA